MADTDTALTMPAGEGSLARRDGLGTIDASIVCMLVRLIPDLLAQAKLLCPKRHPTAPLGISRLQNEPCYASHPVRTLDMQVIPGPARVQSYRPMGPALTHHPPGMAADTRLPLPVCFFL